MDILGTMKLVNLVDLHGQHGREISTGGTTVTSYNLFKKRMIANEASAKRAKKLVSRSPVFFTFSGKYEMVQFESANEVTKKRKSSCPGT